MKKPATRLRRCNRSSQPTMMDSAAAKCGKARTLQRYQSCRGANQTRHAYSLVHKLFYVRSSGMELQEQRDHRNDDRTRRVNIKIEVESLTRHGYADVIEARVKTRTRPGPCA